MADRIQASDVLPRPRIPTTVGILNLVFGSVLILGSLMMAAYSAVLPLTSRVMTETLKRAQADYEAKRQVELKGLEAAEKAAATASEKRAIEKQRKALAARPKMELPIGMDFEKMGLSGPRFAIYAVADSASALVLDILMLAAGIGLVRRQMWGVRLGLLSAGLKIVRLVLVYGYATVAIIPPIAQGSGRVAFEAMAQQFKATGQAFPPGLNAVFFTRIYAITYTVMAVSMILFGSIYPAIVLWLLSRPGARAACEERARHGLEPVGTRVVGILNIVFASSLILFGLCMGAYITALPLLGRLMAQVERDTERRVAAQQQAALKSVDEALAKATTEQEKQELEAQREVLSSRPKNAKLQVAQLDLSMMGLNHPTIRAYYWCELASGLILNLAMITAGIALVRRKPWGITLGIATAAAKIVRLVAVYGYFALAVASLMAQQMAGSVTKMIAQQQVVLGAPEPPPMDTTFLASAYARMFSVSPWLMIAAGVIYPLIALYVLITARAEQRKKVGVDAGLDETWR
jgi:hypothetical protein